MKALLIAGLLLAGTTAAIAESATPWTDDLKLLNQCEDDIAKGGILGLSPRANDVEAALAGEKRSIDLASAQRPESIVLTDGTGDALMAMMIVGTNMPKGATKVSAVPNPYPLMSFYLASYYNETQRSADALRVLDAELALSSMTDELGTGDHWAMQIVERGAALMALRRWPEVLENEDKGLKAPEIGNAEKARLLRGRGYALTELNRLEEAQAAYQDSLKIEPDSELAKHELGYIQGLMAGKPKSDPGALTSVQKKPEDPPAEP